MPLRLILPDTGIKKGRQWRPFFKPNKYQYQQSILLSTTTIAKALVEPIDSTCCVDNLLLTSIKRMALRTNVKVEVIAFGGTSFNHVTAAASRCNFFIFWVDFCLHNAYLAAEKGRNHTRVWMIRK
ncbi:MAG: hypothetical protein ACI82A_000355 [Candidatus Azotimanducaceae bacterium]|jgi:hypothetical protein